MEEEFFNPRVYNFVLPEEYAESFLYWDLKTYEVSCPNSSVLLDHTLAIIWHIFNNNGAEILSLNRADIAWALRFLESIDTKDAGDTTDLNQLIKLLRNLLITRYAMEDEKSMLNQTKTMASTIGNDFESSSLSMDEYLNCTEVQEDIGKAISTHTIATEVKCTKAEMIQMLKNLKENSTTFDEAIEKLEKS